MVAIRQDLLAHEFCDYVVSFPVEGATSAYQARFQVRDRAGFLRAEGTCVSLTGKVNVRVPKDTLIGITRLTRFKYDLVIEDPTGTRTKAYYGDFQVLDTQTQWGDSASLSQYLVVAPKLANTALAAFRVVCSLANGKVGYPDLNNLANQGAILGITTTSAAIDTSVNIALTGEVTNIAWNWVPGDPIWLSTDGQLTQTEPTSGFKLRLGHAVSSTSVLFNPDREGSGGSGGGGPTNLSLGTRTSTTVPINNSNGTGVTIPVASATLAGTMSATDKTKLDSVPNDVLGQSQGDARYRLNSTNIPASEVSGTLQDSQIPASIARDSEVSAAVAAITTTSLGAETTAARTLVPTGIDPGNTSTINGFLSWLLQAVRGAQTTLSGLGSLATLNSVGNANITDVAASKLTGTLDIARIPTGSTASTVTIGNDSRLSDQRVPTDGSVTNAKVAAGAAIDWSKVSKVGAVATDVGALSQAAGDARYRLQSSPITSTDILDGTITNADISATAGIALSKLATDPLARANHTGTQTASTISDFNAAVTTRINATSIDALSDVTVTSPTTGQVLKWNGTNWVNDVDSTSGGAGATNLSIANRTATTLDVVSDTGLDATVPSATTSLAGLLSGADKTKLDGIATGATANSTDAQLRDRATHTGSQNISTITGLQTALDGKADVSTLAETIRDEVGATLVAGANVTIVPDDLANTITISSTGGSGGGSLLSVDTYAAARALTAGQLTGQTLVHVRGRTSANDGAGGIFAVVSGAGTDDGGVVLSVASNTMRLVRQYEGIASAAWWGVLPSSNDVGPALQAAQDWADGFSQKRGIFIPEGFYYIRTPVILKVPTEGVRPEGSSDGNHGTVFQWVSPATWPSTVNGRLCDLFEPVFQTEFNNATTLRNISLYGDYGGGGSNKDTYLDGAMFPSLKFFKIPTNGMTGIELARGVEIINCKCQGFLIGMQNRDASHTRIDNCTLDGNYVGMWYWSNRGDHAIKDTGLTSHIAGTVAGGEGWTVQMDGNHLGFGTYGLLQIGTPRFDPLRDTRSQWRHWYNNSYTVKKASRFNVSTLSGAYGEFQLGDTVGLFNQDTPSQNGIWIVNSGAWTRDPSFTPVKDAVVVVRFSANVGIRETVWRITTDNPVIGQPITFQENPIGGVWECLFRNSRFEACGETAIYTFANSTTGNCEFEFTGAGFDTQIGAQIFNLSPAMIAAMGGQTQEYLFRFGVIGSTFLFKEDNFTNSGISPQAGAARLGNYIHQLNLPANVTVDLAGLGKVTFGTLTNQRSEGALLTKVRQSGDNAISLNPYQDMPTVYNPGKFQPGGLYDLLNPAAWNAGGDTVRTLVDAASVDPYPIDMAIALPSNAKAIYFDKTTNPWAWGWRQTATFPVMGQRYGYFWAWVKGRVSLKIRPRNGSGQIIEYRGDTRSEISGWQPLQLGNMDFSGATHIEFRIDSENSSSFWIAGAVFSWDDYAPYSETTRPATRDGFQLLNGNFATTIDTTTLTANRTAAFPNKSGTVAFSDDTPPNETTVGAALRTASDQTAGRAAIGLARLAPTATGLAVRQNGASYASPNALSVQNNANDSWLEILNSYGAGGGAFFGVSGSGTVGDSFELFNWQGGAIRLNTAPTAATVSNTWVFNPSGNTTLPGVISPKWYNGIAGVPAANTVAYGSIGIVYDASANPDTYPVITNGAGNAWLKILTLDSSGVARPSAIQISNGATLTAMLRATKTIAGTNPETITVTGAAVGDIVELSKPINGEVTAANTVTFNGAGLSGTITAIVKRYA